MSQGTVNSDDRVISRLEDSVTTFKTLLWTEYALSVISLLVALGRTHSQEVLSTLIFFVLLLGFAAWFNVMLLRGRNWARMAYVVLIFLAAPAIFFDWSNRSGAEVALDAVSLILSAWLIRMMFTEPIKGLFTRRI